MTAAADRWLAKIGQICAWVWACEWAAFACLLSSQVPDHVRGIEKWPLLKQKPPLVKNVHAWSSAAAVKKSPTNTSSVSVVSGQVCLKVPAYLAALLFPSLMSDRLAITKSAQTGRMAEGPHTTQTNRQTKAHTDTANEVVFSCGPCWGWLSLLTWKIQMEGDVSQERKSLCQKNRITENA